MKILLDECVDERLADDFAGHDPATPQPVCMPWMLKQAAPTGLAASVEGSLFRATADMAPLPFERPGTSCYSRKRHEGGSANRAQKGEDYPNFVTSLSKTQVDRLGDRLRKGKVEEDDFRLLDAYRRSFSEAYEEVVAIIRGTTQLDPTGRPAKSTTSITEKLRRETIRLSQVQDIAGCRLVVQDVLAQNQVVERLRNALPKAVVVDRREKPSFGYRAVHIIATARDKQIEIQIRTELQHLWAQLSEKLSDALDPAIKYGGGDSEIQEHLSGSSTGVAALEDLELRLCNLLSSGKVELQPLVQKLAGELSQQKRDLRRLMEEAIRLWGSS